VVGLCCLGVVAGGAFWLSLDGQGDCPPVLFVDEHDEPPAGRTVNYTALSPERQAEFDAARAENYTEIPGQRDAWGGISAVRYRGEPYTTTVAVC